MIAVGSFTSCIDLEQQLGNIDRCRSIFEKWLDCAPMHCEAWIKFADLEKNLGEHERVRAIYELATSQQALDAPELLWKSYIDFEIEVCPWLSTFTSCHKVGVGTVICAIVSTVADSVLCVIFCRHR